jgi:hypothetical protein
MTNWGKNGNLKALIASALLCYGNPSGSEGNKRFSHAQRIDGETHREYNPSTSPRHLEQVKRYADLAGNRKNWRIKSLQGNTWNTADNEQITSSEWDWKFAYVNMTIKRTDELKNAGDAAKVSLARSKVELAQQTMADQLGTALWNDGTVANAMGGLRHIIATANTVGGIDQSANSWHQGNVDSSSTVVSMSALQTQFTAATIGSESPTVGYGTRSIYDLYYNLLQPQQRSEESLCEAA